jgi:hypothetical protein
MSVVRGGSKKVVIDIWLEEGVRQPVRSLRSCLVPDVSDTKGVFLRPLLDVERHCCAKH